MIVFASLPRLRRFDEVRIQSPESLLRVTLVRWRRDVECGVLTQNLLVELAQSATRLDAEPLDQRGARGLIGLQRVGLAPGLIERQHQLPPGPLRYLLLSDQRLQLGDHLLRASEREPGVDPVGHRRGTSLLEPADLGLRKPVETEIRKCLSAPEIECFRQHALGAGGVTGLEQAPALGRKPLEATRVELFRFDP